MSKRRAKKSRVSPAGGNRVPCVSVIPLAIGVPADEALPSYRLEELKCQSSEHIVASQWDALLELSRLSHKNYAPSEQEAARAWLLRIRAWALVHGGDKSYYQLTESERTELTEALANFVQLTTDFYRHPEFTLFLSHHDHSLEYAVAAYSHLATACQVVVDMDWLAQLRRHAKRLIRPKLFEDEEPTDAQQSLLARIPDISTALEAAYAFAKKSETLTEEHRLLLATYQAELRAMTAEAWDYAEVATAIRTLPSPSPAQVALMLPIDGPGAISQGLTPEEWAFLYELGHAPFSEYARLLSAYPAELGCTLVDGLRQLVRSFLASGEEVDAALQRAVNQLAGFFEGPSEFFGSHLAISGSNGPLRVQFEGDTLYLPLSDIELLLRVVEQAPTGYPRTGLLMSLYRVFDAYSSYGEVESKDVHKDIGVVLGKGSLPFQFILAAVYEDAAVNVLLLGHSLCHCVEAEEEPPRHYFPRNIAAERYSEDDAIAIIDMLEQLVPKRDHMTPAVADIWQWLAHEVFVTLSHGDASLHKRTLALARMARFDLAKKGLAFWQGYLEQVAGDPRAAFGYYLSEIDAAGKMADTAAKNALQLWRKTSDPILVDALLALLQSTYVTSTNGKAMEPLLKDLKARQEELGEESQFAQTARNRWPTVTPPARKLLGVLATITRFKNFKELGSYAGLDENWTQRHYNKLIELGMIFDSADNFEINPVIRPLIEQESQHAVVGRIVRGDGTSAVKQVFNSQREFSVYQVIIQLCPNHLVFPNCSLQSVMSYERMKTLVDSDDFGYYLRASVDIVVVSSTTFLPMLAIEVDSIWHDTDRQQLNDDKKDRLFAAAGIPFMRLRPVGSPSENTIRGQVAEHLDELVRTLRTDLPGYEQARGLLEDLSVANPAAVADMLNIPSTATLPPIGPVSPSPASPVALE